MFSSRIDKEKRTTFMPVHKAQELAAALMADEADGWEYVAVLIDAARGYAIVRAYDEAGNVLGEL